MSLAAYLYAQGLIARTMVRLATSLLQQFGVPTTREQRARLARIAYPKVEFARRQSYVLAARNMAHSAPGIAPAPLRPYTPQAIEKILADVTEPRPKVRVTGDDTAVLDQVTRRSKVTVTGQFGARLARHADAAGRDAVVDTAERHGGTVGWARVLSGAENCARCVMLASRGPVYKSRESAGGGGRGFHDHCDCRAVLVRKGHDWEGHEAFELYEDLWGEATKGYSGHSAELALRRQLDRAEREGWTHQELLDHLRGENGSTRAAERGKRASGRKTSTGAAGSTSTSDEAFATNQVRVLEASLAKLEAGGRGDSQAAKWQRNKLEEFRAKAGAAAGSGGGGDDGGNGGSGGTGTGFDEEDRPPARVIGMLGPHTADELPTFHGWQPPANRSEIETFTTHDAQFVLDGDGTPNGHGYHRDGLGIKLDEYPPGWTEQDIVDLANAVIDHPTDGVPGQRTSRFSLFGDYRGVAAVVRVRFEVGVGWRISTVHPMDAIRWGRERTRLGL